MLKRWARGELTLLSTINRADGRIVGATMTRTTAPEEVVESAAARVRPLFLQGESIQHGKVMRALQVVNEQGRKDADIAAAITALRNEWKRIDPYSARPAQGYAMVMSDEDGQNATGLLHDHQLAWAYIYGDVVHSDAEKAAQAAGMPIRERFLAASILVAKAVILTVNTLAVTQAMVGNGSLVGLDPAAFTDDAVVDGTVFTFEATWPPARLAPNSGTGGRLVTTRDRVGQSGANRKHPPPNRRPSRPNDHFGS